ncbi:DUF2956 domain-containing protein [Corallincola spongiicola]|uniref:DUF2956 domain-containing protein n=1 Tax=Corallincola spongiicola TaxID=2520508 RepID=A0ABY1WS23_9GAMM|nr:DUF2956 domain-containing protein [Corallincola spongiicola]TAA47521.1 DUF2956 domain-containing protein [Corallincola spongiicola]
MTKYKKGGPSSETVQESDALAKATQRPGQTKEQTKLIAQGIQKGIELYKKQHKAKLREQDKRKKRAKRSDASADQADSASPDEAKSGYRQHPLPWILLLLSWLSMGAYLFHSLGANG